MRRSSMADKGPAASEPENLDRGAASSGSASCSGSAPGECFCCDTAAIPLRQLARTRRARRNRG
jgi:hypothetical protein